VRRKQCAQVRTRSWRGDKSSALSRSGLRFISSNKRRRLDTTFAPPPPLLRFNAPLNRESEHRLSVFYTDIKLSIPVTSIETVPSRTRRRSNIQRYINLTRCQKYSLLYILTCTVELLGRVSAVLVKHIPLTVSSA